MSKETSQWLNSNVLIGCTDRRGTAWHYRADLQSPWSYEDENGLTHSGTGNHYPGAIPVVDVMGRLFNWEPLTAPVYAMTGVDEYTEIPNAQRVYPSDNPSHTFWIAKGSYVPHDYGDSLVNAVADLIDDSRNELVISSAGLLQGRAVAWVEVSVPDSISTPEGIEFRPNLLATTSLNGTIATTYKRTVTDVVCDNTRAIALGEKGQTVKVMHTKYSSMKLGSAREALAIIHTTADDIEQEFAALCRIDVTDKQFFDIVGEITKPAEGKEEGKAATTMRERKEEQLSQLWRNDTRVTPWKNTGYGVIQAFNTWGQHFRPTRKGTPVAERNMLATIKGDIEAEDRMVYETMTRVLSNA